MTTRDELIARLLALPAELAQAEHEVLRAARKLRDVREAQTAEEDYFRTATQEDGRPVLDGRNEETRAAQLRALTATTRQEVARAEDAHAAAALALRVLQHESSLLRAVARLLGPETDAAESVRLAA